MSEMVDDIDDDDDEEERNMMVKMMSRTKVLEEREKEERDHGTSDALICLGSGDDFFFTWESRLATTAIECLSRWTRPWNGVRVELQSRQPLSDNLLH